MPYIWYLLLVVYTTCYDHSPCAELRFSTPASRGDRQNTLGGGGSVRAPGFALGAPPRMLPFVLFPSIPSSCEGERGGLSTALHPTDVRIIRPHLFPRDPWLLRRFWRYICCAAFSCNFPPLCFGSPVPGTYGIMIRARRAVGRKAAHRPRLRLRRCDLVVCGEVRASNDVAHEKKRDTKTKRA